VIELSKQHFDLFREWGNDPEGEVCDAIIWELGGCVNGSHQPFTIVDAFDGTEIEVRQRVQRLYPDAEYKPLPRIIEGGLFE